MYIDYKNRKLYQEKKMKSTQTRKERAYTSISESRDVEMDQIKENTILSEEQSLDSQILTFQMIDYVIDQKQTAPKALPQEYVSFSQPSMDPKLEAGYRNYYNVLLNKN